MGRRAAAGIGSKGRALAWTARRCLDLASPLSLLLVLAGLMQPEAAERLTVELARRAGSDKSASTADLPKIEGKMLPQKTN